MLYSRTNVPDGASKAQNNRDIITSEHEALDCLAEILVQAYLDSKKYGQATKQ